MNNSHSNLLLQSMFEHIHPDLESAYSKGRKDLWRASLEYTLFREDMGISATIAPSSGLALLDSESYFIAPVGVVSVPVTLSRSAHAEHSTYMSLRGMFGFSTSADKCYSVIQDSAIRSVLRLSGADYAMIVDGVVQKKLSDTALGVTEKSWLVIPGYADSPLVREWESKFTKQYVE